AIIATPGSNAAAIAAKAATTTIPIVFSVGGDPIQDGLVVSLGQPGGNATGVSSMSSIVVAKLLAVLREAVPNAEFIGLLVNPSGRSVDFSHVGEAPEASVPISLVATKAMCLRRTGIRSSDGSMRILTSFRASSSFGS